MKQIAERLTIPKIQEDLIEELREAGADVTACYQCGRCSAGCPVTEFFDLKPMEVLMTESRTVWLCASCETCTTRCPNGIDIARMMDVLRSRALRKGQVRAEPKVVAFHKSFLGSIRNHGRVFEMGMLTGYMLRTGDLFSRMGLGLEMFKRGKIKFLPERIKGTGEIRAMFKRK